MRRGLTIYILLTTLCALLITCEFLAHFENVRGLVQFPEKKNIAALFPSFRHRYRTLGADTPVLLLWKTTTFNKS